MKSNSYQTGRFGVWAVTGLTLLLSHLAVLAQTTFSNNSGITINDNSTATPYPSVITSSGLTGLVEKVTVTFTGLTHGFPADIDALLVEQSTPSGSPTFRTMLMGDAGSGGPGLGMTNVTLTFADAASANLPQTTQITSGTYKPTDYEPKANELPGQPGGPFPTSLGVLSGANPNGTWSLYVQDDTPQDAGSMAGWSIAVFTTPVITNTATANTIPDQVTGEEIPIQVPIYVTDSDTPNSGLTFTATSGNTTIVPNANLVFSSSGNPRTLTITPANNQNGGPFTITVTVSDGIGNVVVPFNLTVTNVNDAPTISLNASSTTIPAGGISTNITVTLTDPDTPLNNLTLSAASSNESVVSATNVFFTGTGGTRTMTIAPNGSASGTAVLTITVSDNNVPGGPGTATATISVTVTAPVSPLFANTGKIVINDNTTATPYASPITVSGISGNIGRITVTLADVNHPNPSDINVLLVGPGGKVLVMSHAGGSTPLVNGRLVFVDTASAAIPANGPIPFGGTGTAQTFNASTNKPSSYPPPTTSFVSPAPAGPYGTAFTDFVGTTPNGTWTLYVTDDATPNAGTINDGWILSIQVAPTISPSPIPAITTNEDAPVSVNFSVADFDGTIASVTASSGNTTVVPNANLVVSPSGASGTPSSRTLTITPSTTQHSTVVNTFPITISVTDNSGFVTSSSFNLTVTPINDAPTITPIGKQVTSAGVPIGPIPFTVADPDNALSTLTINATSSNTKVIPNANIVFGIDTTAGNDTITLFPVGNQTDTNILITITVTDVANPNSTTPMANTTTLVFLVDVLAAANPQFSNFSGIAINDTNIATPYPSTVTVSGLTGKVSHVKISLYGVTHPSPVDISVLLVGPTGANVVVLSDAGGANALSGEVLIFDDLAAAPAPQSAQITDGTYQPTNYEVDSSEFTGVAGPYGSALSVFKGTVANGTWSLYVIDDKAGNRGQITGWTLDLQTAPVLSTIPDTHTAENLPATIRFTVGDEQSSSITNWTITGSSANPAVVANSGFAFTANSGANRTVVITPVLNAFGTAPITITVTDQYGNTASTSFNLIVDHVNQLPTIGAIANQTISAGQDFVPGVTFTVNDVETPAGSLTVTATSSDQTIVQDSNITVVNSGGSVTLSAIFNNVTTGTATITVKVTDSEGGVTTKTFTLTVSPAPAFANTTSITINDNSTATPYPSTITVANVGGLIGKVTVKLLGLTHRFPSDIEMLLVGPSGGKLLLMGDAGDGSSISNVRLVFADSAPNPLPNGQITSGTYRPTDLGSPTPDVFPSPAPSGPYNTETTFAGAFLGTNPNGTWQLFVVDDTSPDGGVLNGGWMLVFETQPTVAPIADQTTQEDTAISIPITLADSSTAASSLAVTVATTNGNSQAFVINGSGDVVATGPGPLFPAANIVVTGTGFNRTLTMLPSTNASGSDKITVTVTDPTLNPPSGYSTSTSFNITVTPVNDPSVFTGTIPPNQTVAENGTISTIPFKIADVDTPREKLLVTATSSNPTVIANAAAQLTISGTNVTGIGTINGNLAVAPNLNANGSSTITISVTDTSDSTMRPVTTSFVVTVTPVNQPPTFVSVSPNPVSTKVGTPTPPVTIVVNDVDTPINNLTVTATSQNTAAIPQASISLTGSGSTRTLVVNPIPTPVNGAVIQLAVNDGQFTVTSNLVVNIVATGLVYGNNSSITVNDNAAATPYPSTIPVGPLQGTIGKVTVAVNNINHPNPDDLDLLLVGPGASPGKVMLMSDAGDSAAVSNLRLIFDDAAGGFLPRSSQITSGTYLPTDYIPGDDVMPSPAPAGPYGTSLSGAFNGSSANGTWSLYVRDDRAGGSGTIAEGWFLTVTPNPFFSITPPATITRNEDDTTPITVTFQVKDENPGYATDLSTLTVEALPANGNLATIRVIGPDSNGNVTLLVNPNTAGASGTTPISVVVRDRITAAPTVLSTAATINLVVVADDDPPTAAGISSITTTENVPVTVKFTVTDIDDILSNVTVRARSSSAALVDPNTGLAFAGSGTNFIKLAGSTVGATANLALTVTPVSNASGTATVFLDLSDLTSTNTVSVPLTVTFVDQPPTISIATNFVVVASGGTSSPIGFTVADPDDAATALTVTASSSDPVTIPTANIVLTGTGASRTVTVTAAPNQTNLVTVTLTVSDPARLTASASFAVLVTPTRNRVFRNGDGVITIPNVGAASPYPSTTTVSGLGGIITKATVTLNGLTHTFPHDLEILLVSPTGKKSMILADAGGGGVNTPNAVTNITLTFDDAASGPAPLSAPLVNNSTYQPTDYNDPPADAFPSPAPAGPYTASLAQFNGDAPNGTWSLFVIDDTPPDGGTLNGWTLTLQTAPVVTGLPSTTTTVNEDTVVSFNISVNDETNPAHTYTFTNSFSSNTAVVPNANIQVTPTDTTGTNFNVKVQAIGPGNVTISLVTTRQDDRASATSTFAITFTPVNDFPSLSAFANVTVSQGTPSFIPFTSTDDETPNSLTFTATSSNTALLPNSNLTVYGGPTNYLLTVTPIATMTGTSTVTVAVSDPQGATTTQSFQLTVTPDPNVFANTGTITINDSTTPPTIATPYPSTITVSGITGRVTRVTVTFVGLSHRIPGDIEALLVGPQGQQMILLGDAGINTSSALTNATFVFDDLATAFVPQSGALTNGTYKPTDYDGATDSWPGAPTAPRASALSTFTGVNPNGTWSLYIVDDTAGEGGQIAGGWSLRIISDQPPTISSVLNQLITHDTSVTVPFTIADVDDAVTSLQVSAASSNQNLVPTANIVLSGTGSSRSAKITPVAGGVGTTTITLTVADSTTAVSTSFLLTVTNITPSISPINDQSIGKSTSAFVPFAVFDPDTPITNLQVTGTSSSQTLVPNSNIVITGTGTNRSATITPVPGAIGLSIITFTVSDGNSTASSSFILTVTNLNAPPIVSAISDITIPENTATSFVFTISDPESPPDSLVVGATSSNTNLISSATTGLPAPGTIAFGGSGNNRFAIVTPATNAFGTAIINVTVSDGTNTTTSGFILTVTFVDQAPVLATIPDQSTPESTPRIVPLSAVDVETPLSNMVFTATSGNTNLFTVAVTGTAASPSLTITPVPNQFGTNTATVTVTDAGGLTASQTFKVAVTFVKQGPKIGGLSDLTVAEAAAPVPTATETFFVTDRDTPVNNLTFTITSSNPTLLPKANIVISGTGTNRTLSLTPAPVQAGVSIVTIVVSDGSLNASSSLVLTVTNVTFVPRLVGFVDNYTTSDSKPVVINFSIYAPADNPTNLALTATSSNPTLLPTSKIVFTGDTTTTNRTVTLSPVTNLVGTTIVNLTVSDGANSSSTGFILTVNSNQPPTIKPIADQTTPEDQIITVPFVVSDPDTPLVALKVTATSSNTNLVSVGHITFTGTANNRVAVITPNLNQTGFTIINITVSDGRLTATAGFILTVTPVPHAPTISTLTNLTVSPGGTVREGFTVNDIDADQDPNKLLVSASSSNQAVIPAQNILLGGAGTNRVIEVSAQGTNTGTSTITVTVTDSTGLSSSTSFVVTVVASKPATLVITRLSNTQVRLILTGTPGAQYAIEASTDLKTWTQIATVTADATGAVTFTDTTAVPSRFYRARSL